MTAAASVDLHHGDALARDAIGVNARRQVAFDDARPLSRRQTAGGCQDEAGFARAW